MVLGALVVLTGSDRGGSGDPGQDHIEPPIVREVFAPGRKVDLAWTWADPRAWDHVMFQVTTSPWDPDVGAFVGDILVSEDSLRQPSPYTPDKMVRGTLSYRTPATGLHVFSIGVRAWNRPATLPGGDAGHDATFRSWTREKVMVGSDGWSVVQLPGIHGDMLQDAHDPEFRFFFELYHGPKLNRDCALNYQVGWPAAVHGQHCEWATGERALILANPDPGSSGPWRLTFGWTDDNDLCEVRVPATERNRRGAASIFRDE
jgi:hypothetical protein